MKYLFWILIHLASFLPTFLFSLQKEESKKICYNYKSIILYSKELHLKIVIYSLFFQSCWFVFAKQNSLLSQIKTESNNL